MNKGLVGKIRINLVISSVVSIVLTALFLIWTITNSLEDDYHEYTRSQAKALGAILDVTGIDINSLEELPTDEIGNRITLMSLDGTVIYDSAINITTMDNHINRPEVISALTYGEGFSVRYSDTMGVINYYYAVRLMNDNGILRVSLQSATTNQIISQNFVQLCLLLFFLFIMCILISNRLTKQIIDPINLIDLDDNDSADEIYRELYPFVRKIAQQKEEIEKNLSALSERASTIETITQNMGEGLVMVDGEGNVVTVNNGFKKFIGRDKIPKLPQKMVYITRNLEILKSVETVLNGERYRNTLENEGRYYRVMGGPIPEGGGIVLFSDITEEEKSSRRRREFSSNVSHELRTPLTSISGYGELLRIGMVKTEDVTKFGAKIHDESIKLLNMIENIMKLSRLDELSDVERGEFVDISLKMIAINVIQRLQFKAEESNVVLKFEGTDITVRGNMDMIENMIYNLTENAIKYNRDNGEVKISVGEREIYPYISISDSGIGIPPSEISHIFERFYRVDKARSSKTGGSGIGLAIVKHIADYHNCIIDVESVVDSGTTINILFEGESV